MNKHKLATFGAGCFWCVEAIFQDLKGVLKVYPGYTGGRTSDPTYEDVCSGNTGHAEVIQIEFDPTTISYSQLVQIFFQTHDPTTLNRQGNDIGTQYRSAIFYHDDEQREIAAKAIQAANDSGDWTHKIVTELNEMKVFYKAENYHENYYKLNPNAGYCRITIKPKVEKFRKYYRELLK